MIAKFATNTGWMLLMIVITGLIYVRMAPHDTAALHLPPPIGAKPVIPVMKDTSGLFEQVFTAPPADILAGLNANVLATPRTRVLAGSVEEGMITYVTRSLVFGFPDYTTVHVAADAQGSRVTVYGRQRFGKLDFGVNSARIQGWLGAVEALK